MNQLTFKPKSLTRWGTQALIGICYLWGENAQGITLDLVPPIETVMQGETVAVEVVIDGLGEGSSPSLASFDLDLSFDPNILQFSGLDFGSFVDLSGDGLKEVIASTGMINFYEISFDDADDLNANQPSSFTLATVKFQAIGIGENSLITISAINDLSNEMIPANSLLPLERSPQNASVTVMGSSTTKVPEPSFSLLNLGLIVVGALALTGKQQI